MSHTSRFLLAASLLPLACATQAQARGSNEAAVVVVEYRLASQPAEQVEESLVTPLERRLVRLPGMSSLDSTATHDRARLEVGFAGDADEQALAAVKAEVERFDAASGLAPAAVVEVGLPRLASGFLMSPAAADAGKPAARAGQD